MKSDLSPSPISNRWQQGIVGGLLVLYFILAMSATVGRTNVFDEPDHIAFGYVYWHQPAYYQLPPDNGVAAQAWAALPLWLNSSLKYPELDKETWKTNDLWWQGHRFLYSVGNNPATILFSARMMIAFLGMALGGLIFLWSKELFGLWGGLISLLLFVFCPTMLAHGSLATTDMAATLGFFATTYGLWKLSHTITWPILIFSVLSLGFLVLSKMSSPLIVPVYFLILLVRFFSKRPAESRLLAKTWKTRPEKLGIFGALLLVQLVCVVGLLWIFYNFSFTPLGTEQKRLEILHSADFSISESASRNALILQIISEAHLLPPAYVEGMSYSLYEANDRSGFLCGNFSRSGWWWFFPLAFLIKTPIGTLLLFLSSFVAFAFWKKAPAEKIPQPIPAPCPSLYDLSPLLILGGIYGMACVTSHIDIGHRHMMPIYPVVFVLAGANVFWLLDQKRVFQIGLAALLAATVIESLSVRPYYLAFFNRLIGGPSNGYHYLVDSSLDWGQDLPGLHHWLEKNVSPGGATPVYLSYFGSGDPHFYGIDALTLPGFFDRHVPQTFPLQPGVYCLSATMLQSVYGNFHRPWSAADETWYGIAVTEMNRWNATVNDPAARQVLIQQKEKGYWDSCLEAYGQLRFARLCAYLRHRDPDAEVGYSILIFRLTDADLRQALAGTPPE